MAPLFWLPRLSLSGTGPWKAFLHYVPAQLARREPGCPASGAKNVARFFAIACQWGRNAESPCPARGLTAKHSHGLRACDSPKLQEHKRVGLGSVSFHSSSKRALQPLDGIRLDGYQAPVPDGSPLSDEALAKSPDKSEEVQSDGGKTLAAGSEFEQAGASLVLVKKCMGCGDSKLLVDFKRSKSDPDGLNVWCRACLAILHAERCGRTLPAHMQLSLEEAQKRAKICQKCGILKEIRHFCIDSGSADSTHRRCRACLANDRSTRTKHEPASDPQSCIRCRQYLPAEAFHPNKCELSGRLPICKLCVKRDNRARKSKWKESDLHITRVEKRCCYCKIVKQTSEFSRHSIEIDGLQNVCKSCAACKKHRKDNLGVGSGGPFPEIAEWQ